MLRLILIRHGGYDNDGRLSSRIYYDHFLTNIGIKQIRDTAKLFSDSDRPAYFYASPMKRTEQSAKVFLSEINSDAPILLDDRIKEIDYGELSGQKESETKQGKIDKMYAGRRRGDMRIRIGETGENGYELLARNCRFLIDIISRYQSQDCDVFVFTHEACVRAMENVLSGDDPSRPRAEMGECKEFAITDDSLSAARATLCKLDERVNVET